MVVSGPGTVNGSVLTFVSVGTVILKALQVGDDAFNPALPVERSVTSALKEQKLVFPAVSAPTYGDAPIALAATADSGLPVEYVVLRGPARISQKMLILTGAGEVVVRARWTQSLAKRQRPRHPKVNQ